MNTLIVLLISYLSGVSAQNYGLAGLYNPSSLKSDAVFINPALLPDSRMSGVLGLRQSYFMSELTDFHFSFSTKISRVGLGLGVVKSGIKDVVSDYTFLIGAGVKRGFAGTGLNVRFKYLKNIEDNLSRSSVSMDCGFFAKVYMFDIMLSYLNFLQPSQGFEDTGEKSESELILATSFKIPEPVTWMIGVNRTPSKTSYRIGSELWFTEGFGLRLGIMDREVRLGLALKTETYGIDVSFGSSRELGTSYVISTNYSIR